MKKYRLWAYCACVVAGLLVLILVFSAAGVRAQSNTATPNPSLTPSPSADPPPEQQVAGPEEGSKALKETETLQVRVEEIPPKDFWDKVAATSGLSGAAAVVLAAGVGLYATSKYDQRQLAAQRIQAFGSFIPQLRSSDEVQVESALLAISVLDLRLAMDLAKTVGSPEVETALSNLAARPDQTVAEAAKETREYLEKTRQPEGHRSSGETV
jgi:hypothetical protein